MGCNFTENFPNVFAPNQKIIHANMPPPPRFWMAPIALFEEAPPSIFAAWKAQGSPGMRPLGS